MPNRLPVPKELEHLIEKRTVTDRRQGERRATSESEPSLSQDASTSTEESTGPTAVTGSAAELPPKKAPTRRKQADPRSTARRKSDKPKG